MASGETAECTKAEYSVTVAGGKFSVTGIDQSDGEEFVISNIQWDGEWLSFSSLMESTQRRGVSRIRYVDTNEVEFVFTFTETETWRKKIGA